MSGEKDFMVFFKRVNDFIYFNFLKLGCRKLFVFKLIFDVMTETLILLYLAFIVLFGLKKLNSLILMPLELNESTHFQV